MHPFLPNPCLLCFDHFLDSGKLSPPQSRRALLSSPSPPTRSPLSPPNRRASARVFLCFLSVRRRLFLNKPSSYFPRRTVLFFLAGCPVPPHQPLFFSFSPAASESSQPLQTPNPMRLSRPPFVFNNTSPIRFFPPFFFGRHHPGAAYKPLRASPMPSPFPAIPPPPPAENPYPPPPFPPKT